MSKILIAMSGGVDSACAAHLLLKQGHDVVGVTLKLTNDDSQCDEAKVLADYLGILHVVYDVSQTFERDVVSRFKRDYFSGLTPNPCVYCNQIIKFGLLYDFMSARGFDYLATGHYARIIKENDLFYVVKAATHRRDQSYYLYHLSQKQLAHILFPLGDYKIKKDILDIYTSLGLSVLDKPESRGICFTKGKYFAEFLADAVNAPKNGTIIDDKGNIRGYHRGFYAYTIGQKNIIGANIQKTECVIDLDSERNLVVIGDEKLCYSKKIVVDELRYRGEVLNQTFDFKIFTWGLWLKGKVTKILDDKAVIEFAKPVRAVATGQYAVAYMDDKVVVGGRIIKVLDCGG